MSKLVDGSILVVNDLVKTFDVVFLMVRQLVVVGMLFWSPESPGLVTEWIVAGSESSPMGSATLTVAFWKKSCASRGLPDLADPTERSSSKDLVKILDLSLAPVCLESIAFCSWCSSR